MLLGEVSVKCTNGSCYVAHAVYPYFGDKVGTCDIFIALFTICPDIENWGNVMLRRNNYPRSAVFAPKKLC